MKNRRVDVRHVVWLLDSMKAQFVGRPVDIVALDSCSSESDTERVRLVFSSSRCSFELPILNRSRSTKFRSASDVG